MSNYMVSGADGNTYGPATEQQLVEWMRDGRIHAGTAIISAETNQRVAPQSIPALAPLVGLPQPALNTLMQPTPAMLGYAVPGVSPGAHLLTSFSTPGAVLLHFVTLGIFPWIHFMLMHGQLPKNRQDDPSAGKAIGFFFIPFFNFYWVFFAYLRLIDRINEQRSMVGLPPSNLKPLFVIHAILNFIPFVNYASFLILAPIFVGYMRSSANEMVRVSRGPGF